MNPSLDKALHYLTGNEKLNEVPIEAVEKLTVDYPFFSVGQLMLARKLNSTNHQDFEIQLQKTSIYFTNPYWLHYQLLNNSPVEIEMNSTIKLDPVLSDTINKTIGSDEALVVITTEFTQEEIDTASELAHEQLSEIDEITDATNVPITTEFTQAEIDTASELAHEQLSDTDDIIDATDVPITTEFTQEEIETASELAHEQLGEAELPVDFNKKSGNNQSPQIANQFLNEFEPTAYIPYENTTTEVSQAEEEMTVLARDTNPAVEEFITEVVTNKDQQFNIDTPNEQPAEPDEHELMFQNIKAMLDATSEEAGKEVDGAAVPIDPYHTIDYFASQGIKLELDPNPQDKLGIQVKKFTQWLRHMKKLGPEDAIVAMEDVQDETEIIHIADSSNTAREVVTEAMAQVLEKQGKKDKAIQLYTKLSFLNPHKSAYFADKIKTLKDS